MTALPDKYKEVSKFPRNYLSDVIYTMCGAPFERWTRSQIEIRNKKMVQQKNLAIDMDPTIAALYQKVIKYALFISKP